MNTKGQVTIFILVAIMIVSVVLIFFLWARPTYFSDESKELGFENCIRDAIEPVIDELGETAGFANVGFSYLYGGQEFVYLCYTNEYYKTCTVQVPFLRTNFQEQIGKVMEKKINVCYDNSINDLKSQGYSVTSGDVDYEILIEPGVVRVEVDAPMTVDSQKFARFNVRVNSPIYDMVMISTSILQSEAKYGDSDISEMMRFYPDYIIDKIKRDDGTTVYILESKVFGTKFQFASRSLAWPAGYN
ncbi:hypothetical protein KAI32_02370 [Candidatus Pacearchaeota archaeon]|nr:hypothetical protein [Candidatus Pacearchaeota archaeon]